MIKPELLHGLFTTAMEGGIGYWSSTNLYHWMNGDEEDLKFFAAEIVEEDTERVIRIDLNIIELGLRRAIADHQDTLRWSTEPPEMCRHLEDWDYDAGDADMIVQLGIFGEVVYG